MDACYTQEHPRGQEDNGGQTKHMHSSPVTTWALTSPVHLIRQTQTVVKHARGRGESGPGCRKGASSALPPSVPLSQITPGSALSSLAFMDEMFNESFNPAAFSPFRSLSPWGDSFVLGSSQGSLWHCGDGTRPFSTVTSAAGSPHFPK